MDSQLFLNTIQNMLSRILSRAKTRIAPRRTYMVAGNYSNGSWLQLWAHTGGEGAELWLLTVYGAGMHTIFLKALLNFQEDREKNHRSFFVF